jgi:hypothetical protein
MEIQPAMPPNKIRTLALIPEPLTVEPAVVVEAKPIPRSSDQLDLEPDHPTEAQVAEWNAFIQHELEWRHNLMIMADSRYRMLDTEERKDLRGQLYEIERHLRSDVGPPWNNGHKLLPPDLSRALWHEIFAIRGQERINGRFAAAHLAAVKLTNPSLTFQQRIALHRRCWRVLDPREPRIGHTLPKSWRPKPADPLRTFRQAAMEALFPNIRSIER